MSLQEQIKGEIKTAMMSKDAVRLSVVRGLATAFMNELVATKRTPQDTLTDEEASAVIRRGIKQRKDSIEQFTAAGRTELAESEQAELAVLEAYLPKMMSQDDIRPIAEAKKAELGITDKTKAAQLIGALMKDLKGKADGNDVKAVIESLF